MEAGGFDAIEVTEAGLREGIFFERLLGERPPLFEDVRAESVREPRPPLRAPTASTTCTWRAVALDVRRAGRAPGCTTTATTERELLWAACLLHDIGMAIDYDDHHRHSHYLILNAGLPGFTPRELILIGLIARYHRKGEPDASELGDLAEPGDDDGSSCSAA